MISPLTDGTHKNWNCPLFRNLSENAAVRKQLLCFGCLGKGDAIKDFKVNACGIKEYTRKNNRLLLSENQMEEVNSAVNVSAAKISQSNEIMSFLQIAPVSIHAVCNRLKTHGFLDSRSMVSFIAQSLQEKLRAGIQGEQREQSRHTGNKKYVDRKGSSHNKGNKFKGAFNRIVCAPVNLIGKHKLRLQQAEASLQSL